MTDTMKQAVYAAEQQLRAVLELMEDTGVRTFDFYGSKLELPIERKFASLESIEAYCNKVLEILEPSARKITVRHRRGERMAHYQMGEIAINTTGTRWAMREIVVLHELAHHLARTGESHGPEFQKQFVRLVDYCVGAETAAVLQNFFYKNLAE